MCRGITLTTGFDGSPAKIMVVDDNPANLNLLELMLRQEGYEVHSFPRARLALTSLSQDLPDLILLDVNMPEMNGYEMCELLKSNKALADIPVLFISALSEMEDKVKGFRAGGVDFISKPFQFEEVHVRLETHLKLRRAQQSEKALLEQTLNGAVRVFVELIQAASPELADRSRAIRSYVACIARRLGLAEGWQFDLAATLSLLGCITLPDETFQNAYAGQTVTSEEGAMFRAHPEITTALLIAIPRLEPVAEMIRLQQTPDLSNNASYDVHLGARMLYLSIELDRRIYRGLTFPVALQQLENMSGQFDAEMVDALRTFSPPPATFHHQTLPIRKLRAGMILEEAVSSTNGVLVFRKGTVLSETWLEKLRNFAGYAGVREPIRVLVPVRAQAEEPKV
jgi:CheY-like chemotaxis protein